MSEDLQTQITELRAAVSSLGRRLQSTGNTNVTRRTSQSNSSTTVNNVTNVTGITLIDEVPLADSGSYAGASGAWNTLDLTPYVDASATLAYVRFRGVCIQAAEAITLKARAASGSDEKTPLDIVPMGGVSDTCSNDNSEWIPLSSLGFDYQPTYALTPTWSLVLLGWA